MVAIYRPQEVHLHQHSAPPAGLTRRESLVGLAATIVAAAGALVGAARALYVSLSSQRGEVPEAHREDVTFNAQNNDGIRGDGTPRITPPPQDVSIRGGGDIQAGGGGMPTVKSPPADDDGPAPHRV